MLAADPDHVEALHFIGVLYHQTGQTDRAVVSIERALALAPVYTDAHNNRQHPERVESVRGRGAVLSPRGRASARPRRRVEQHRHHVAQPRSLRGGRSAYARAIESNPAHLAAWQNRGNLLVRVNRLEEGVAAYRRVLDLKPGDATAYDALTRALYRAGKIDQALAVYQEWLEADPGNSIAQHMLAASPARRRRPGRRTTTCAKHSTVLPAVDQVLDQLGYRAPGLIGELLGRAAGR